ncbi:MAG TPA: 23S ribosomal RNA methyltransferase Erm [Pseudonocardia sp.]|nr:23S ribosomal RNA methyltransferase Erm [Pseudonocardia sp.]
MHSETRPARHHRHAALPLLPATPDRTGGRHELGQNFLVDADVVASIVRAIPGTPALPVLELGAGDGALTAALAGHGHPVTAVELDPRRAGALRRRCPDVTVVCSDMLSVRTEAPHHVVSNVPFGITTALLRHLLAQDRWHTAVLLLQWEVARKRTGVGGTTLLTAQWWPWVEFSLLRRVPATAFRPVPNVDGGVIVLQRRGRPLVPPRERTAYQALVRQVFERGAVVAAVERFVPRRTAHAWLAGRGLRPGILARDLGAADWAALHALGRDGRRRPRARR